ncbi:unnamed protein product, partial [Ascophyllum nodosum]
DAEAAHKFALCGKLQRDIQELEALREENPTLEELRERAGKTKADIEKFAAMADYGRAGSLQGELVAMEDKIKAMEEEA